MIKRLSINILFLILLFLSIVSITLAVETYNSGTYGSGTYGQAICGDDYCDASESCSSCSRDCSCPPPGTDGSSAGGGGGFFSRFAGDANKTAQKWSSIKKGSSVTMKINKKEISFTQLDIIVKNTLNNVEIKVERLQSNPAKEIKAKVYQFLSVDKFNIEDLDIEKVIIKFKVDKKWLEDKKIDKNNVILKTFRNNRWMDLPTKLIPRNKIMDFISNYVYYEAESSKLSYFAVSVKEIVKEIPSENITLPCIEDWECTSWSECVERKRTRKCNDLNACGTIINKPIEIEDCIVVEKIPEKRFNWLFLIAIIVLVVVYLLYIFFYRKKR